MNKFHCINFDIFPLIIPHKRRIIAIGDIHGDIDLAINILLLSHVIKEDNIVTKITNETRIKEYIQKLKIVKYPINQYGGKVINTFNNTILHKYKTYKKSYTDIAIPIVNQYDIVYRYYKINGVYYIKVVKGNIVRFFRWIGDDTYVVQIGDQIDRCRQNCSNINATIDDEDSDIEILLLFDSLNKLAKRKNGAVISLLGNHEMMNVTGDMSYVSYKGLVGNGGLYKRHETFKQIISKRLACTRSIILIIGNYVFVHGGITNALAKKYNIYDINDIIKKFLFDLSLSNDAVAELVYDQHISPLWNRDFAYIKTQEQCNTMLSPVLNTLNVKGMVIGHTPNFITNNTGISSNCNGSLFKIDTGSSRAFGAINENKYRIPQALEILTDLLTNQSKINILY